MTSVFLSHSHADKSFARKLGADLRRAGYAVWIDEAEINIGDSLVEKIREGLDQVDYVAAILSQASITSPWVTRELDIASNREIEERRVVVLPLLLEKVDLPGFLKGKFYGDFTDVARYEDVLQLLIRKLGGVQSIKASSEELELLRAEVAAAKGRAAQFASQLDAHQKVALRGKSARLVESIREANKSFPLHSAVNTTQAFEVGETPVTLDYLLWAIAKTQRKGSHVLETLLSIHNKWPEAEAMLEAYEEILAQ